MITIDHVAIIVSSEEGVNFYKALGFEEETRTVRPDCHDEYIRLRSDTVVLELYKDATHPKRLSAPEAYGLRHLCFCVDDIGTDYKTDGRGKFRFITDPDGQPIELREIAKEENS